MNDELREDGISEEAIRKLQPIINLSGTNDEKIATMREALAGSEVGQKGIDEVEYVLNIIQNPKFKIQNDVELDLTLARGLNYYTGCIFEVKALDVEIGSITGGGRYDNLTGIFGMPGLSGVGISFGADRIYDVLNQLDLYPEAVTTATQVLFINFGEKETDYSLPIVASLRKQGVRCEIYPDSSKMKKQMQYANQKAIPFVAMTGETEMQAGKVMLKNMTTGEQKLVSPEELASSIL